MVFVAKAISKIIKLLVAWLLRLRSYHRLILHFVYLEIFIILWENAINNWGANLILGILFRILGRLVLRGVILHGFVQILEELMTLLVFGHLQIIVF